MVYFLGIDGGGSKTVTVLINEQKQELARHASGGTNWNSVGEDAAKKNLFEGITQVLESNKTDVTEVAGICLGMSGVDRPSDVGKVEKWVWEVLPGVAISVHSDAVIGLASGTGGALHGVVVISGTGMICYGFDERGESFRAGGWGPLLGDEGSGYAIGMDVLKAVARAADGSSPSTLLSKAVLDHLSLQSAPELIAWAYSDENKSLWEPFASLSKLCYQCAKEGDPIAQKIIDHAADELLLVIKTVVMKLKMENTHFPLVFIGGNLSHSSSVLAENLKTKIEAHYQDVKVVVPSDDPVMGAALLALNSYHKDNDHQEQPLK